MNSLNYNQKQLVEQFVAFTNTEDDLGIAFLKLSNWDVQTSINNYFADPTPPPNYVPSAKGDKNSLKKLFDKYKDADNMIADDGMMKFIEDLGIDPTDIMTLIISWHLGAKGCCFTEKQFVDGFSKLSLDTLDKIKAGFGKMRAPLDDSYKFRDFYTFAFEFNKEERAKGLELDVALLTWDLVLRGRFAHLDDWLIFVKENHNRSIPKDTWLMLYDLTQQLGDDLSGYSDLDAWPVLIDEFVEWKREKAKKGKK